MKKQTNKIIASILTGIKQNIKREKEKITIAKALSPIVDKLSFEPDLYINMYCKWVDIQNCTHEQAIEVMQTFTGGKWRKEYNDTSVTYISETKIEGTEFIVRIYGSKLPSNCKVVEVGEEFVPGYTRKKYKIECGKGTESSEPSEQATAEPETKTETTNK